MSTFLYQEKMILIQVTKEAYYVWSLERLTAQYSKLLF